MSTTLQELESGYGRALTATGSLLPMSTVIRLASHAHHYLTIFDKATGRTLYLGRTRRLASADQRIVLLARDWAAATAAYCCQVIEPNELRSELVGEVARGVSAVADTARHSVSASVQIESGNLGEPLT